MAACAEVLLRECASEEDVNAKVFPAISISFINHAAVQVMLSVVVVVGKKS